ncbi:MAG: hypothetical protein IJT27_06205 [Clostridia bacterium]|nr:hypothetical protein [Clostridia bacterium]
MNSPKFSVNALLIVVTVFAVITLFVTVGIVNMRNPFPVNEYYPIEDTPYAVRYSTYRPNGIYKGPENTCTLVLEGSFGTDWGIAKSGDTLFANEYTTTDLGLVLCDLVKIDLISFEKEVLMEDTILRGTCSSGEPVCVSGFLMPSDAPQTNPLCALYSMTHAELDPRQQEAEVKYLDPQTGAVLYSERTPDALSDDFDALYLARTLREVRK